ncbi:hypothetical protein [Pseudotabrizicola alkalilacus]|uniref:Uncharacterized protein n=1 Tax=Pseudotabrizicola alkalilacus TaxID=2305252 RepID=A0A411Z1I9_9RHOB|nr:hypothetical protein [Pseudotabrizicola alkalilacus]RGP36929.1 hypothetical protein D1012_12320 [Pseudotabrizicola alkalilacus]
MNELDLTYIEQTVVAECARLINDQTGARPRVRWKLSGAQIDEIEAQIGPRLTRLALSGADFRPAHDDSDDWLSVSPYNGAGKPIEGLHAEDFWIALRVLDVDGRLSRALGLSVPA